MGGGGCNFHLNTPSVIVPSAVMGPRGPKRGNGGSQCGAFGSCLWSGPKGHTQDFSRELGPRGEWPSEGIGDSDGHFSITGSS